jgi:hypothetical protein
MAVTNTGSMEIDGDQFTTRFDEKFATINHYCNHPQMIPFVGSEYGTFGPRILLIAESHYLKKTSTVHLDAENWYKVKADQLQKDECNATNTRKCLNKDGKSWKIKSYTIFRNLENALIEAGYPETDNTLRYIAYMNGFQRPAVSRLSIKSTPIDQLNSVATIQSVVDIIQPEHIIFVSRKAYFALGKQLSQKAHVVPHPASAWWNRRSKRGTGKEQFLTLLKNL